VFGIGFDFGAQTVDVGIDRPVIPTVVIAPHLLQQLLSAERASGIGQEEPHQLKLFRRELYFLFADLQNPVLEIHGDVAMLQQVGSCGTVQRLGLKDLPAEDGLDSGFEFAQAERLGDIVVGADLKADDFVNDVAFGCQHDDGAIQRQPADGSA